jgi:hypothetical protein
MSRAGKASSSTAIDLMRAAAAKINQRRGPLCSAVTSVDNGSLTFYDPCFFCSLSGLTKTVARGQRHRHRNYSIRCRLRGRRGGSGGEGADPSVNRAATAKLGRRAGGVARWTRPVPPHSPSGRPPSSSKTGVLRRFGRPCPGASRMQTAGK